MLRTIPPENDKILSKAGTFTQLSLMITGKSNYREFCFRRRTQFKIFPLTA